MELLSNKADEFCSFLNPIFNVIEMKWIIHDRYNFITIFSFGNSHFVIDIVTKSTTSSSISIMNSMHLIANVKFMFTLFTTYLLRSSAKYQNKPSDVSCELNDKQKTVCLTWISAGVFKCFKIRLIHMETPRGCYEPWIHRSLMDLSYKSFEYVHSMRWDCMDVCLCNLCDKTRANATKRL